MEKITVEVLVNKSLAEVWDLWTNPKHITQWNHASDDWHSPKAENDLKPGGKFCFRMEAKDGSVGFDFNGVYSEVRVNEKIAYTIEGGRSVEIFFSQEGAQTKVVEIFEAEDQNPIEMQKNGWQTILNNFKKYAESQI